MVAGNTLLKFFFGQMLEQLREDGAARVHPSLFHPEDRQKEVNPALFQFKSFLLRPCVILLIFNGLEWPPEILAGQQCSRLFVGRSLIPMAWFSLPMSRTGWVYNRSRF